MAFFNFRKNQPGTYLATFSVSIDLNDRYKKSIKRRIKNENEDNDNDVLSPSSGPYRFHQRYSNDERNPNEEKYVIATYEELKKFAVTVLNHELQDECEQLLSIPIMRIKVIRAYEGSIQLFFTVLFGIVDNAIRLKDIYDGVSLLKTIAEKKLEQRFINQYGDYFRINVNRHIPRDSDYYGKGCINEMMSISPQLPLTGGSPVRDGFFYYLLIANVVLLSFVIALVCSAVVKVYFQ